MSALTHFQPLEIPVGIQQDLEFDERLLKAAQRDQRVSSCFCKLFDLDIVLMLSGLG
jgi:hypothetical protein